MNQKIIVAGHGGQGVMAIGQMLSYAGMLQGLEVSYYPAYGPEMRGGSANCSIVLSDAPIGSAVVSRPCSLLAMNADALSRFAYNLVPGGLLLMNSSLIEEASLPTMQAQVVRIAANELALEAGSPRAANMVLLGAYNALGTQFEDEVLKAAFLHVFGERRAGLYDMNLLAMQKGAAQALAQASPGAKPLAQALAHTGT